MNNRITLILNYIILVFSIAINPSYWMKNIKNLKKKKKKKKKKEEQKPLRNIQSWEAAEGLAWRVQLCTCTMAQTDIWWSLTLYVW